MFSKIYLKILDILMSENAYCCKNNDYFAKCYTYIYVIKQIVVKRLISSLKEGFMKVCE